MFFARAYARNSVYYKGNKPHDIEHYVVRFVRELGVFEFLGVPERHLNICTKCSGRCGKGVISKDLDLTHFVDNDSDCGWSVIEEGSIGLHHDRIWYHFDCALSPNMPEIGHPKFHKNTMTQKVIHHACFPLVVRYKKSLCYPDPPQGILYIFFCFLL